MERGAQEGNKNATKGAVWLGAIRRALGRYTAGGVQESLDKLADLIVKAAAEGDRWAIEHIAERLDGKPRYILEGTISHTVTTGDSDQLKERLGRRSSVPAPSETVQ